VFSYWHCEHFIPRQRRRDLKRGQEPGERRTTARGREAAAFLHHDLEEVRALLGHARIDTIQVSTAIRPPQLKRVVSFYEAKATKMLSNARP